MMKRSAPAKIESDFSLPSPQSSGGAVGAVIPIRLHVRSDLHLARKTWHMCLGLGIVAVYLASGMSRSTAVVILGSLLGLDLLIETTRLRVPAFNEKVLKFMGVFMRSCEVNRVSGVPYYIAAAVLAIGIFPKPVASLSLLYLACGDPMASIFGILYGDRGPRFRNGKSLIGSLAGVFVCALVTTLFLNALRVSAPTTAALTLIGGFAGGMAEMLPLEVDDNFSIPIVSGFILWLGCILLGI